jgi:5-methylcytosine-specific restriction endonuclease McrA
MRDRNSAIYRQQRARAIERDGCKCVVCRTSEELTAHHKIPRYISRDDSLRNLVTLCRACHDQIEELDAIPSYLLWFSNVLRGS